jgi:cytochrome c553
MKRALLVAGLAVVGAGAIFASDLIDALRFGQAFEHDFAASEADAGPWPQAVQACVFCHGPGGQSRNREYPSLAGQPAAYIEAQLKAFASGQRRSATMGPLARQMDDRQMKAMAAYFARQVSVRSELPAADAAFAARGLAAVQARSCQACHGATLGGQGAVPGIAGLGETYLAYELAVFKTGERRDPGGAMNGIAASLSTQDIPAVAHYLASLPTPARNSTQKP